MKFYQNWFGRVIDETDSGEKFPANVPGNIQNDYAIYHNWGDINYDKNCTRYAELEEYTWVYETELNFESSAGERVYFVSHGIDYYSAISLNGVELLKHEGMFSDIEIDITDFLKEKNILTVTVFAHPKRKGAVKNTRDEADASVKPPVCYGWDWHPRLLVSGMFDEAYIETRKEDFIRDWTYNYEISEDFKSAEVEFIIDCNTAAKVELFDRENNLVYSGDGSKFILKDLNLWWCNGHGEPYLYSYKISTTSDYKEGKIGFRKIEIVMNEGEWSKPKNYPMSRSNPPITICLNGKRIFGKGSNFATPEIFTGTVTRERYEELLLSVKEINMNMLRMWGGCGIQKKDFYELCDQYGIMVWQEFPLACNHYGVYDAKHYCEILKQEAISIINRLKKHCCLTMWCGGNELFNNWSCMTEQSAPLRLLNAICFEYSPEIPFIMTAPVSGMAHGPYSFRIGDKDCFYVFQHYSGTAYTEFGNASVSPVDYIKTFIPEEKMNDFVNEKGNVWELHHTYEAQAKSAIKPMDTILDYYKFSTEKLTDISINSEWLQSEGFKSIFEEARRQWPTCSMAANWFYTEPWKVAVGNSLILYPFVKKPSYYAVKNALRPALFSARIPKFDWKEGEKFSAEIWFLNDTGNQILGDEVNVTLTIGDEIFNLAQWTPQAGKDNLIGPMVNIILPKSSAEFMTLKLTSVSGKYDSEYKLRYYPSVEKVKSELKRMNAVND